MKRTLFGFVWIAVLTCLGFSQSVVVPVVALSGGGLLGGVQNGKWIAPAKVAPAMKPKMEFILAGWNGVEEGGVSLAEFNGNPDVCNDYWSFSFELEMKEGVGLGTNAKWNPAPRRATAIPTTNSTYKTIVSNFLKTKGFRNPVVTIKQIYKVDLDGDGVDEVLISASRYRRGMTEAPSVGDYSFTLLRSVKGKLAQNHLLEGEFFPLRVPKDIWPPNVYEFNGVADLNGDGKMEIAVSSRYYEGGTDGAFEMKNGKPFEIKEFSIECGV
ncbi:MAG TPA: hypothetical protein VJL58_12055 [Pyrinomonadaceae bacterium]|nr:hypothetical protein [Pyrinomonadaceae bacterium]